MRSIADKLELVKRSLENSLAELEKIQEAELAMRELCAGELETIEKFNRLENEHRQHAKEL